MKIQQKMKINFVFSIILCSMFLFFMCFQEIGSDNQLNIYKIDDLKASDAMGLDPDDWAELHGYADQYVDWSFSTTPYQIINVWALDPLQYSYWISGLPASGYLLSTSSSDSGRFNVPEGNTWHIIFWNDEIGCHFTIVSFYATFIGDSRPPLINVIKPSSTSIYPIGSNQIIEWSTQGSVGNLKIELFKGTSLYSTIISNTPNDGQHNWQVPEDCPAASDYRIKITDNSNPTVNDYSSYFTIIHIKSLTIIDPTSESEIVPKTTHTIIWESTGSIEEVKIELYKGSELLKEITSKTENDGSYSWIPHYYEKNGYMWNIIPQGTDYRIKIKDIRSDTYVYSEYFTITNIKSLTILEPNSKSSYKHGETMLIRWQTDTPCENLTIKVYYRPPGSFDADKMITISQVPNIWIYYWVIPMDFPHGDGYYLIIEATDNSVVERSEDFTIGNPSNNSSIPSYSLVMMFGIFMLIISISISHYKKEINKYSF